MSDLPDDVHVTIYLTALGALVVFCAATVLRLVLSVLDTLL